MIEFALILVNSFTMDYSAITGDVVVASATFGGTHLLYKTCYKHFSQSFSSWKSLKPEIQNRLAVETALLPTRFGILLLCIPILINAFRPVETWKASDTDLTLLSWYVVYPFHEWKFRKSN